MKIAILDDYQDVVRGLQCFSMLNEHDVKVFNNRAIGVGQLSIRLSQFEVLVLIRQRTNINRALLSKLPKLRLIYQTGDLTDNIDLEAAEEFGVKVISGGGDPHAVAELTWALIMASSRKIPQYTTLLQDCVWQTASLSPRFNQLGRNLENRQLGIWGYGKIGQLVANYARAFNMKVVIWGSERSRAKAKADGFHTCLSKQDFFATSDIISLHLRLDSSTRHIIQLEDLLHMKTDALLVNTSHADLIETDALTTALAQGRPGFAALDVFEQEPLSQEYSLRHKENVLLTPHIGHVELDSYEQDFFSAFNSIVNFYQNTTRSTDHRI